MQIQPRDIIEYWYDDRIKPCWFRSTPELDQQIRDRYADLWQRACNGELDHWLDSAEGCLALVILLDQFPLNMFRGEPRAFSSEAKAVDCCLHALDRGFDNSLGRDRLAFLYMPLMHSENPEHQALSVRLYEAAGLDENARFARHHRDIIARFGRFPHRNAILGRRSSPAEIDYLNSPEAFTG